MIINLGAIKRYRQSPYEHCGFRWVWLKRDHTFREWTSQAHRGFTGSFESSDVSRDDVSREIGHTHPTLRKHDSHGERQTIRVPPFHSHGFFSHRPHDRRCRCGCLRFPAVQNVPCLSLPSMLYISDVVRLIARYPRSTANWILLLLIAYSAHRSKHLQMPIGVVLQSHDALKRASQHVYSMRSFYWCSADRNYTCEAITI